MRATGLNRLVAAGGVSANVQLRRALAVATGRSGGKLYTPCPEFCTDNGAMIALAGYLRLQAGAAEPLAFAAHPRWEMTSVR